MLRCFLIVAFAFVLSTTNDLQIKDVVIEQRVSSTLGKYLAGHVFKTTSGAIYPQHCLSDCWVVNDRCQSFNFLVDAGICELNDATNLTHPQDFVDRHRVVYLTNPVFGREKIPQMPRHNAEPTTTIIDPCLSNPCQHGGSCVPDEKLGFRCHGCDDGFYGQQCEEWQDHCASQPCGDRGTCRSNGSHVWCDCYHPHIVSGQMCDEVTRDYQFDFNKTNTYPTLRESGRNLQKYSVFFWFKTKENTSYFMSYLPDTSSDQESLSFWRNGTTIYVELLRSQIFTYDFNYSYPLNDNKWHSIVLNSDRGSVFLFLDGMRHPLQKSIGKTNYILAGEIRLGYYQDSSGTEHYFEGSIGSVALLANTLPRQHVKAYIIGKCIPHDSINGKSLWNKVWKGFEMARRPIQDCESREIVNSCPTRTFDPDTSALRRLETSISPPVDLTAFTMSFYMDSEVFPVNPYQIACYGDDGTSCALSVVFHANMTLEIVIASTRVEVNLVPIFNSNTLHMVITWDNQEGVLEVTKDDVLQSRIINVEKNKTIPGQSRFMVGGSDVLQMNYNGDLWELNLWDEVLPQLWLAAMAFSPGNTRGNVVAWRDLVPKGDESAIVSRSKIFHGNVGGEGYLLKFESSGPDHYLKNSRCTKNLDSFTFSIWLKLSDLPAAVLRYKNSSTEIISLSIRGDGELMLVMFGIEMSILQFNPEHIIDRWHFISITWSTSGILESNVDGVYQLHSTRFNQNQLIDEEKGEWNIGGGEGLLGLVNGANIWARALPAATIRAMARGGSNVLSNFRDEPSWREFYQGRTGNVKQISTSYNTVYLPDRRTQLGLDDYCNTHSNPLLCPGKKYYARLGYNGGRVWGCICENVLSNDHNYINGSAGSYVHSDLLESRLYNYY